MRRGAGAGVYRVLRVLLLAPFCLAGDCVDGVTPDCSDAATQCGPNLDGSTFDGPVSTDASTDAPSDAPSDARPADDGGSDADASIADADASDQ